MRTPAEVVIDLCGGPQAVAHMLGLHPSNVHRWTYPKAKGGTGGYVPTQNQQALLDAAQEAGIGLRPEHFFRIESTAEKGPTVAAE